ncbi:MAG: hypothetical protein JWR54_2331 [Mucilaginibacter sp.]|nr:hypothetical protein [Mucilaginibacter sp.]
MNAELNSNEILSQIKRLNKGEQIALFEKVALLIRKAKKTNPAKLSDISGVGSSLWHGADIDEYVDGERQW